MLREVSVSRLLCFLLFGLVGTQTPAADVEVVLQGLSPRGGRIYAFLFDDPTQFEADVQVRATVSSTGEIMAGVFTGQLDFQLQPNQRILLPVRPNASTAKFRFTDFPPGEYAVALFQDLDGDQTLAASLRGVPKEPWGMSNNPRIERPAKWSDAVFTLPAEGITVEIKMQ